PCLIPESRKKPRNRAMTTTTTTKKITAPIRTRTMSFFMGLPEKTLLPCVLWLWAVFQHILDSLHELFGGVRLRQIRVRLAFRTGVNRLIDRAANQQHFLRWPYFPAPLHQRQPVHLVHRVVRNQQVRRRFAVSLQRQLGVPERGDLVTER